MSTSTFDTLPVEILYRIFDHLDVQTIIFSVRYVCKQLYLITDSYNRYNFNFKSIAKPLFRIICRLVPFESVIALTLSNEDKTRGQIELFLSLYNIEQFTRLESLTLLEIDYDYLHSFLTYIVNSTLKSLSISVPIIHTSQKATPQLLSSVVVHHTLKNLYMSIGEKEWNQISWSNNWKLSYLRLVNSITFQQFCLILDNYRGLRTLVLKEINSNCSKDHSCFSPFKQLTSLTFENGRIDVNQINQCLSFTPSLTYLKIVGDGNLFNSSFDGHIWEKLLQARLIHIEKFEFFFVILTYSTYRSRNMELLMQSFQTRFWLEKLKCSIVCDHIANSRKITLYTLPICKPYFAYDIDSKKSSISNVGASFNPTDMDYVQHLELQLTKDVNKLAIEENIVLFRNVTSVILGNDGEWPERSLRFLSNTLDFSRIIKLSLSINFLPKQTPDAVANIEHLFKQTPNLRSFLLFDYWAPDNFMTRMETICSMISRNIKHLQIRVKNPDDIKYILEHLKHLTSVTFEYAQMLQIDSGEIMKSLSCLNRSISSWNSQQALHVWLQHNPANL